MSLATESPQPEPSSPALSDVSAHLSREQPISFDDALRGPAFETLRRRLAELTPPDVHLSVEVVPGPRAPSTEAASRATGDVPADVHLLLDVHRLLLLRPADADDLPSLRRFVSDGYPIQPAGRLAEHVERRGFPWLYSLDVIELLPHLLREFEAGEVAELDMSTGEVSRSRVHRHPALATTVTQERSAFRPLQRREVDASLRSGFPSGLDELLSPAGLVRRRFTVRDRLSLPFTTTEVRWNGGRRREACYGKSRREDRSRAVAVCEALERFQVAMMPASADLVHGSYDELGGRALDPHTLFFGRSEQHPDSSLPPFAPDRPLYWTRATPVAGGEEILVPAQEVWFQTALLPGETTFIHATTNGCALGGSPEEAALFALLESVERDAFLTAWYLRRRPRPIDPDSVSDAAFQHFRHRWHLAYADYDFRLFDITTDLALPAVMAVAVRRSEGGGEAGPRVFFANACRLEAEDACRAALEDLAGFDPEMTPGRRAELRDLFEHPEKVRGPAEHFGLYALDETFERLRFLGLDDRARDTITAADMQAAALLPEAERYDLRAVLDALDAHIRPLGVGLYFKDISQQPALERGLHCVKAVTPGLYPVWFGHGSRRFHPTRRLRRLARQWRDAGQLALSGEESFNLELHPFS